MLSAAAARAGPDEASFNMGAASAYINVTFIMEPYRRSSHRVVRRFTESATFTVR
jgi:hypothetical protein